mgnify:CR=1 FL=1
MITQVPAAMREHIMPYANSSGLFWKAAGRAMEPASGLWWMGCGSAGTQMKDSEEPGFVVGNRGALQIMSCMS